MVGGAVEVRRWDHIQDNPVVLATLVWSGAVGSLRLEIISFLEVLLIQLLKSCDQKL